MPTLVRIQPLPLQLEMSVSLGSGGCGGAGTNRRKPRPGAAERSKSVESRALSEAVFADRLGSDPRARVRGLWRRVVLREVAERWSRCRGEAIPGRPCLDAAQPCGDRPDHRSADAVPTRGQPGALEVTFTNEQRAALEKASALDLGFPHDLLNRPRTRRHVSTGGRPAAHRRGVPPSACRVQLLRRTEFVEACEMHRSERGSDHRASRQSWHTSRTSGRSATDASTTADVTPGQPTEPSPSGAAPCP